MPEGDTIWRAAVRVRDALEGLTIDAAGSSAYPLVGERLEGAAVEEVESRGKHLLVHFDNGLSLHTHLGMQGRWRVAQARRPMTVTVAAAVLVPKWLFLQSGNRRAVCEHAAVIELLARRDLPLHPVLRSLGPDLLVPAEIEGNDPVIRARGVGHATLGELLLDQRVAAGIGNIWRCETLFVCGENPFTAVAAVDDVRLRRMLTVASRLMTSSLDRRPQMWVYRRAGLPCRRCGARIMSARVGVRNPRTAYWCPRCQPERAAAGT